MPNGAGLGAIGEVQADIPIVRSKGTVFSEVHTQYKVCSTHSELESPKPPRPADTQYLTIPEQSFGGGGGASAYSGIPGAGRRLFTQAAQTHHWTFCLQQLYLG